MIITSPNRGNHTLTGDVPAETTYHSWPGIDQRQHWALVVTTAVAVFLPPWCTLLAYMLPPTTQAQHWALAWIGLDCAIGIVAALTARLIARHDPRAALTAAAGAALLFADAWFDVCTSAPGLDHTTAIVEAACFEIPLALAAVWFAVTTTTTTSPLIGQLPAGQG